MYLLWILVDNKFDAIFVCLFVRNSLFIIIIFVI